VPKRLETVLETKLGSSIIFEILKKRYIGINGYNLIKNLGADYHLEGKVYTVIKKLRRDGAINAKKIKTESKRDTWICKPSFIGLVRIFNEKRLAPEDRLDVTEEKILAKWLEKQISIHSKFPFVKEAIKTGQVTFLEWMSGLVLLNVLKNNQDLPPSISKKLMKVKTKHPTTRPVAAAIVGTTKLMDDIRSQRFGTGH